MARTAPLSFTKARPPKREKGRGARSNPTGRYEVESRCADEPHQFLNIPEPTMTSVIEENAKSIITRNTSPYVGFDRSINPYRGCEHGCIYCFARPTHAYMGLSSGLDFETKLFAKKAAAKLLTKELSRKSYEVKPIAIGTNTDAYQPIERKYFVMRDILRVLVQFQHPVSILTKSDLILRDIDILSAMAHNNLTRCMISITTFDRRLARAMEPRASTPTKRLAAIKSLAERGIPTGVVVGPVIPGLNDSELEDILGETQQAGGHVAAYTIIRLPFELKQLWREWLEAFAPDRAKRVMQHIRDMNGGKDYDANWSRAEKPRSTYSKLIQNRFSAAVKRLNLNKRDHLAPLNCTSFQRPKKHGNQMELFE